MGDRTESENWFFENDKEECCDHRYVREDLFESEAYYGQHDDPEDF